MYRRLYVPADADILICAGDDCEGFNPTDLQDFFTWYATIPARLRIFVRGNCRGRARDTTFINVSYFEKLRTLL